MKKTLVYILLLLFCFLYSNRSQAVVANIPFTIIVTSEDFKSEVAIDVKAPFQLVIDNAEEEREDLFCDDEFDDTDDDYHQKIITLNTNKFGEKAFLAKQTPQSNHSSTQNVKIFILFCSLKLHC
jgi:hypothetical protein